MPNVPLREMAVVNLDGSGNGTASVGPLSARERWHVSNVSVSVSKPVVNESSCYIYVGDSPTQPNFRDATVSGSSGDSTDAVSADVISIGRKIYAVWSGGDSAHQAVLTVTGTKDI